MTSGIMEGRSLMTEQKPGQPTDQTPEPPQQPSTAAPQGEEIKVSEAPAEAEPAGEAPAGAAEQRRGPLASLADIEQEVEKAFERFFRGNWLPSFREWPAATALRESLESRAPKVDVRERDDQLIVDAELPGMNKSDIEVSLGDGSITIKASQTQETTETEDTYVRREISRGVFTRTVSLPSPVDANRATATYANGVLTVTLPKLEGTSKRSIEVR
jgi:HSP20 family protein